MKKHRIYKELERRILVLDGGMGSLIQEFGLTEKDFRSEAFANWELPLKGCNDLLAITRPDVIADIHRRYLEAGADIISTDSFNANAVSLADYGLQEWAYRISRAAAEVARSVADEFTKTNPGKPRYVGGSVGPTNRSASISGDMSDTSRRDTSFTELADAYAGQIEGLIDGGADIIQLETFFDTLNCKAAIFAAESVFEKKGARLPVIVSGTLTNSGRTLSGQTVEAFYTSVAHAGPLAVGFNCSFGAKQLLPYLKRLSDVSDYPISVYPNAGLPNLAGGYDESPEMMAADVEEYLRQGLVNIVGGCCGTTPAHIAEIAKAAEKYPPRRIPERSLLTSLSGLEPLYIDENSNFINIGERANVAGSAKFARLIREEKYEEALSIAGAQVEGGSSVIDICFDDGLIDGAAAMTRFLNMAAAEPDIARVPFMVDSSNWDILEAGLRCIQGKSIINSISLKEGEGEFLRRAKLVRRYGAAAVVMLFDEKGQADTYERKVEVAGKAYRLLTENGFPPEDIVFDPNILAVATGIEEHNRYGRDFIEACRWIRQNLPGVNISGGVSNLSFAFRGIDKVRRAMHSVFLYHAIQAGMNMGIVNPAMIEPYDDIEPELRQLAEDVILDRRPDAPERLAACAEKARAEKEREKGTGGAGTTPESAAEWRSAPVAERIRHAMLKGIADHIERDAVEAFGEEGGVMAVIDNMFMPAMEHVGELFGAGKMFLPQVVKTARVMKKGVGALLPLMQQNGASPEQGAEAGEADGQKDGRGGYPDHERPENKPQTEHDDIKGNAQDADGHTGGGDRKEYAGDTPNDSSATCESGRRKDGQGYTDGPTSGKENVGGPGQERCSENRPTAGSGSAEKCAPDTGNSPCADNDSRWDAEEAGAPGGTKQKIVIATVKGDVHDIGKNIVSVVMACNGYRIRDLGVMAECDRIVDAAAEWGADAIGLSALITPSLEEMAKVVRELERRGMKTPVLLGGATTSGVHTAVKIAPLYSGPVIHCRDASDNVVILNKLFGAEREEFLAQVALQQETLRRNYEAAQAGKALLPLARARANGHKKDAAQVVRPRQTGIRVFRDYPIKEVIPYIDWSFFFGSWGIKGAYPELLDSPGKGEEARKLLDDAQALLEHIEREKLLSLNAVVGILPAGRDGDDIVVEVPGVEVPGGASTGAACPCGCGVPYGVAHNQAHGKTGDGYKTYDNTLKREIQTDAGSSRPGETLQSGRSTEAGNPLTGAVQPHKAADDTSRSGRQPGEEQDILSQSGLQAGTGSPHAANQAGEQTGGQAREQSRWQAGAGSPHAANQAGVQAGEQNGELEQGQKERQSDSESHIRLPMLRNQSAAASENLSLADYVSVKGDYVGLFALSAGVGLGELAAGFRAANDDYSAIMAKLLADRLTEAFAEVLHSYVRREMWGYESGAKLSPAEVLSEQYAGRRMAFGYPASPDHSLKKEVFGLLDVEKNIGLRLNESYMIEPGEALCGLIFADADIGYFDIGKISEEQLKEYAERRGMAEDEIRKLLPRNI